MNDRIDVTVLGTVIGTASGWDEIESDCLAFYDFRGNIDFGNAILDPFKEVYESISLNFTTGEIEAYEGDQVVLSKKLNLQLG